MKKIYTTIEKFNAEHPHLAPVSDLAGVNVYEDIYFIDRETCEIFKFEKGYKAIHTKNNKKYNLVFKQIETDGTATTKAGDPCVHICGRVVPICKIVASTFIVKPNSSYTDVLHVDGDKQNNYYTNLRWCSRSEITKNALARRKAEKEYYKKEESTMLDTLKEIDDNFEFHYAKDSVWADEEFWKDVIWSKEIYFNGRTLEEVIDDYEEDGIPPKKRSKTVK